MCYILLGKSIFQIVKWTPLPPLSPWHESVPSLLAHTILSVIFSSSYFSCSQFHQHFTYNFYAHRSQKRKKIQLSHKYLFTLSGSASIKAVFWTLMKLSTAVNFTNIWRAAFTCTAQKILSSHQYFLCFWDLRK